MFPTVQAEQWGKNTEKIQLNKFNVAFKNACYYLKTSILNTAKSAAVDNDWQIVNLSLENFEIILQGYNDTNQGHFEGYLYIAIGQ